MCVFDLGYRLSEDACSNVAAFFEDSPEADICTLLGKDAKISLFDGESDNDDGMRPQLDLFFEPSLALSTSGSVFVRAEIDWDEIVGQVPYGSWNEYIAARLMLAYEQMGFVRSAYYWRLEGKNFSSGTSSVSSMHSDNAANSSMLLVQDCVVEDPIVQRIHDLTAALGVLLSEEAEEGFGEVPDYLQFMVSRELCHIIESGKAEAEEPVLAKARFALTRLLEFVSDSILANTCRIQRLSGENTLFLLALKHGISIGEARNLLKIEGESVVWRFPGTEDIPLSTVEQESCVRITSATGSAVFGHSIRGRLSTMFPLERIRLGFETSCGIVNVAIYEDSEDVVSNAIAEGYFKRIHFKLDNGELPEDFKLTIDGVVTHGRVIGERRNYIPKCTFVIPAYNCEEYLYEAIESVIGQDIGFQDNIQLVLVNDGSSDGTGEICQLYADAFPNNIIYVNQENAGANAARLAGLRVSRGTIINFLDADDKWSKDACRNAYDFLKKHTSVNLVSACHKFFGVKSGNHPLHYKYDRAKIVDLRTTYNQPQLALNNVFFRRAAITEDFFASRLTVSEDFTAINNMLLSEMRYGIMVGPVYWYRKRESGDSAIDTASMKVPWYFETVRYCHRFLFEESKKRYGSVIRPMQYAVMYDLQWRLKGAKPHPLTDSQLDEYRSLLVRLLAEIDDDIIFEQRNLTREQKLYVYAFKHGLSFDDARSLLRFSRNRIMIESAVTTDLIYCWASRYEVVLTIENAIDCGEAGLKITGILRTVFPSESVQLTALVNGGTATASLPQRLDQAKDAFFDKGYYAPIGYAILLPEGEASLALTLDGVSVMPNLASRWFSPLSCKANSYCICGSWTLRVSEDESHLIVSAADSKDIAQLEAEYRKTLPASASEVFKYRDYALSARLDREHPEIWLLSDRLEMANDNGEALFEYLCCHQLPGVEVYYVISHDSPDYDRLSRIGNVIPFGSDMHKRMVLIANKVISSSADDPILNRFRKDRVYVQDLETFDFVFLQHGIIKDDLSQWLRQEQKNISMFVTSAMRERKSILENPRYGYGEDVVKCTGLPRHDKLIKLNEQITTRRQILIAPTWRQNLTLTADPVTGRHAEYPGFTSSDYFKFYNAMIQDSVLTEAAIELGYEIRFLIHPCFEQEAHKFTPGKQSVIVTNYDYAREFATSAILVTDYSSVAFDFALLKKPIVYTQPDRDAFYAGHTYDKGYYDYDTDGFGPVCTTYERTIEALIEAMRNPVMSELYINRIDSFIYQPENSRCEEVVSAIMDIDKRKNGYISKAERLS